MGRKLEMLHFQKTLKLYRQSCVKPSYAHMLGHMKLTRPLINHHTLPIYCGHEIVCIDGRVIEIVRGDKGVELQVTARFLRKGCAFMFSQGSATPISTS